MGAPAILVADDDPTARDLLTEVLAGAGYRVRAAGGGVECLQLAEAEPFDLALIDLRMPDLDVLRLEHDRPVRVADFAVGGGELNAAVRVFTRPCKTPLDPHGLVSRKRRRLCSRGTSAQSLGRRFVPRRPRCPPPRPP